MNLLKSIWTVTWKIVVFLMLWGILYAPLLVPVANKLQQTEQTTSPQTQLYFDTASAVTILVAAWGMTHFIDKRPFASLGFALQHIIRDVLVGIGIGAGMMLIAVAILWIAGWAKHQAVVGFSGSALALAALAMVANTITQEVLVRGYIQQTIQKSWGSTVAIILSAIIFTLLHAGAIKGGLLPVVNLFAAGVLLGLAYTTTGNLWLPIALHFVWNFFQGPVLGLTVSGQSVNSGWQLLVLKGPVIFTGGAFGLEGGLVATLATVLGIVALLLFFRQES